MWHLLTGNYNIVIFERPGYGWSVTKGKCPVIPLLCFLSDDKPILKNTPTWGKVHREYFEANDQAQFIQLRCGHYVHDEAPQEIADAISGL